MKRLFVAVPVSDDITEKIRPVIEKLKETGADLKFVSHFHFTLKFLGDKVTIPPLIQQLADSFDQGVKERKKLIGNILPN